MSQEQLDRKPTTPSLENSTGGEQSEENQKEQATGDTDNNPEEKQQVKEREKEEEKANRKKKKKHTKRKRTSKASEKLLNQILNKRQEESVNNSDRQPKIPYHEKPEAQRAATIGEALVEAAERAGDKPVEMSDVAAITVAEAIALCRGDTPSDSVTSRAMAAATANSRIHVEEQKIKLRDVLSDTLTRMAEDRIPDRWMAARVAKAEKKHSPTSSTYPGGVAESILNAALRSEGIDV